MKYLKNQHGSTILLVMVVLGVLAAAAVHFSSRTKMLEDDFQRLRAKSYSNDLYSALQQVFKDPHLCSNALQGRNISTSFSDPGTDLFLQTINMNIGKNLGPVNLGFLTPNGFRITSMRLRSLTVEKSGLIYDKPGAQPLKAVLAKIIVKTEKRQPGSNSIRERKLEFPIMLYHSGQGLSSVLKSCFSEYGDAAMCTRMGGVYNHLNANTSRSNCEPLDRCLISKPGIVTVPGLCIYPFLPREVSTSQYLCEWCNQNAN
jgi:hypothetical protein